ncbi:hypothetical protein NliqN6_5474 [Naganishia liquefaciens]|uniref:C2H2-type domain-containing protein n=1 Tax=Naganishia liquefaciens TaxID=104408 RepID=A0A8H3TXT5_9TREE|nr:hypothetical protein NliqN6_5474 [Naganishia liquefaciens]
MQQQQMSTGFIVDGDRKLMQGQVDRRSFQSGSVHSGAPMSRTPSLRPEDTGQISYSSLSPANQVAYQHGGHQDGQVLHRPSAAPIQNWTSGDTNASSSHSSQSMEVLRSQSDHSQQRPRPAPLQLHTGAADHSSRSSVQLEHSPFETSFRGASTLPTPTYSHGYQHPGNRLHSTSNMASPIGHASSPLYPTQQGFAYQQQPHQQSQPSQQQPSPQVVTYTYQNGLPPPQQFAQPYQSQYQQQPPPQQSYTYLQPPQMPPLHHMAHSAPSAIPQQSAITTAAYQQYAQHRPQLVQTGSFSMESSSSTMERPEYTGFSSYPMNRGGDRPHKCDQCTQSFNRNHDLKRHKRIHLDVKPFACNACQKQFSRRDALKRHWLVKNCEGDRSDPNNPAYVPPTGADRKNAAAIPRHYQNASKKAMLAKLEKQRQQAQAPSEVNGSKASPSSSDRSKSMTSEEDEPNDERGQNATTDRQYSEFASIPALSPPTPHSQVLSVPPHSAGSMARSVSHNTTLVTPDEASAHIRAGGQPSSAPFVPVHSQTTYSYTAPEKPAYPNAPQGTYETSPSYGQGSSSTSVTGSMLNNPNGNGDYQFRQAVSYHTVPNGMSDNRQPRSGDTIAQVHETMGTQNIAYANVSTHSTPPGFAGETSSNHSDAQTQSQPLSAQRPVFTMPFGNSDGSREVSENPSIDLSHVKGPWQRWHRPSFPFPVGGVSQLAVRNDSVYDESGAPSRRDSLHPVNHSVAQQPQNYARSSLRLSHSPNTEPTKAIEG